MPLTPTHHPFRRQQVVCRTVTPEPREPVLGRELALGPLWLTFGQLTFPLLASVSPCGTTGSSQSGSRAHGGDKATAQAEHLEGWGSLGVWRGGEAEMTRGQFPWRMPQNSAESSAASEAKRPIVAFHHRDRQSTASVTQALAEQGTHSLR